MKQTMISNNKPLRKTRTFLLKRSESMQQPTEFVPRKSPVVEFPTSPQLIFGEEMLHFGHPQHPLSQVNLPDLFTCAGCKEYGAGKRFVCQQCNFQLHDFCALAPPALNSHPFHFQHQLVLYSKSGEFSFSHLHVACISKLFHHLAFQVHFETNPS